MSSIGSCVWSSQNTKTASTPIPIPNAMSVGVLSQPCAGASMSPYTIDTMPMIDSTDPNGSSWASSGSRDFGSRNQPAMNAVVTIGMFTRNTEPYQKWVRRKPLATGPIMPAQPATAAQAEIAFVRSSGGNTFTRIDSVDGMMNAATTPMRPRHAMSCQVLCDRVAPTHEIRNTTSPNWSAPLRP